jgi:AraC-like DNA-binding protein
VAPRASDGLPSAPTVISVTPLLREAIARAAAWAPKDRPLSASEERLAAVVLDEVRQAPRERLHLPMPEDPALLAAARALVARPDNARRLDAWARAAGMSRRTFTRRFRAETGLSFAAFRTQLRLLVAVEWLATGEPVTRVAERLGYDSPSAFTSAFRRVLGAPPTRFLCAEGRPRIRSAGPGAGG